MSVAQVFAAVALLGFVARLGLLVALHLVPSPYSMVEHAVSDYAVGPTRRLTTIAGAVTTLAWASLALAVWTGLESWNDRTLATAVLAVMAALSLASVLVPTDIEGERLTRRGLLHYVLAIANFGLAYYLMSNVVRLARATGWNVAAPLDVLSWIALIALVGVCATMVGPGRKRLFGIVERVYLLAVTLFYALTAWGVLAG